MDAQTRPTRRRTPAEMAQLREHIYQMRAVEPSLTDRQVFGRLVQHGVIGNTESEFQALRQTLRRMRRLTK